MEENQEESLSQLFDKGLCLHSEVLDSTEETKSVVFQDSVRKGILILEDATRLVSLLDIFSRNENYSELPTDHLQCRVPQCHVAAVLFTADTELPNPFCNHLITTGSANTNPV